MKLGPYPTYEPAGVPWLGDVPEQWQVQRAKWLFQKMERPVRDTDEVVTCFRDGEVTLRKKRRELGFTEALKEIGYQGIRSGDLVIHAMDAFAGAIGVSDSDGKGTPVYSVCKPKQGVDAHYYAYTLREMSRNRWIQALAKGIRERSSDFRYTDFASQPLPFPPLSEQAAIVRYLDEADQQIQAYISAKQRLIELLEEQRQAIIHQAVTQGLNPNVRLKPSSVEWLGELPEHWKVTAVKREYEIQMGKMLQPQAKAQADIEVPYLKALNVQWYSVQTDNAQTMWARHEEIEQLEILPGDLLVCEGGEGGRAGIVTTIPRGFIIQNAVHRVRPRGRSQNQYLQHLMRVISDSGWFEAINSKTTIAHFTKEKFQALQITVPPPNEQAAIVEHLDKETANIETAIDRARRHIALLQEYRTRLIADVVTGKLDVREAAEALPQLEPTEITE